MLGSFIYDGAQQQLTALSLLLFWFWKLLAFSHLLFFKTSIVDILLGLKCVSTYHLLIPQISKMLSEIALCCGCFSDSFLKVFRIDFFLNSHKVILEGNRSVYIANRKYKFCIMYKKISARRTCLSQMHHLNKIAVITVLRFLLTPRFMKLV